MNQGLKSHVKLSKAIYNKSIATQLNLINESIWESVTNTNDWSSVSKCSMVKKEYVNDEYVGLFVDNHFKYRSPIINRGYYLRFKSIEWALDRINCDYVITLGAGFDTLPFRKKNLKFIEIDFNSVALRKAEMILKHKLILLDECKYSNEGLIETNLILQSPNYSLIGSDLRYNEAIVDILERNQLIDINSETKVLIFNEVSLCYLDQSDGDKLLTSLKNYLIYCKSIYYLSYEQLKSYDFDNDGFALFMEKHFKSIGSTLRTLLTREEQTQRLKSIGFRDVFIVDMLTFYWDILSDFERLRINEIEAFDEFEEFHLLCSNYGLTIAGSDLIWKDENSRREETLVNGCDLVSFKIKPAQLSFNIFSHASCQTEDNQEILIFGGFGCNAKTSRHKRLSDLISLNPFSHSLHYCQIDGSIKGRSHSKIVQLTSDLFLIVGGRESPKNPLSNILIKKVDSHKFKLDEFPNKINTPPPCWRHSIIYIPFSNQLVLTGGKSLFEKNFLYFCDPESFNWYRSNIDDVFPRHSHSCILKDQCTLIIFGGLDLIHDKLFDSKLYHIDLRTDRCINQTIPNLPSLYSHTCHYVEGRDKVLILGGISNQGHSNNLLEIDLRNNQITGKWKIVSQESKFIINSHTSHLLSPSSLIIIGGGGNCFSFGTYFNPSIIQIDIDQQTVDLKKK